MSHLKSLIEALQETDMNGYDLFKLKERKTNLENRIDALKAEKSAIENDLDASANELDNVLGAIMLGEIERGIMPRIPVKMEITA